MVSLDCIGRLHFCCTTLALQPGARSVAAAARDVQFCAPFIRTLASQPLQHAEHMQHLQEREAKKDIWKPRWFTANPGGPVFDGEHPEDKCPLWEFTGDVFQQPRRPVQSDGVGQCRCVATLALDHAYLIRTVDGCGPQTLIAARTLHMTFNLTTLHVATAIALTRALHNLQCMRT